MTIELYNTRTRAKEPFAPLDPSNVRMYVCGPTVYDRAHIGNARPVVVFDVLYRLLRHAYGPEHVTYVRNITDVDDKIIARAQRTLRAGESLEAATRRITDETIGWYHEDMGKLGALPPTHEPRCTEFIPQMVEMTQALIDKGVAYAEQGHVLFEVAKWPRYGELSGRSTDDMIAGARVEVAPYKRSPMDFVLWKPSTPDQPGWPSPWGRGRPGWHIECSAMAEALLGREFDIHGGGIDLQFPHHENELAQSCCVHGTERMAQFWMHNGFLQVEGEKMSKSLGNFFTVRDLLDRGIPGEVIRFVLLSTHYRQPMDWTERKVEEATKHLKVWRSLAEDAMPGPIDPRIYRALADDLNTPSALSVLNRLRYEVVHGSAEASAFVASAQMLGLLTEELDGWTLTFRQEKAIDPNAQSPFIELFEGVELPAIERPEGVDEVAAQAVGLWVSARFAARKKRRYDLADRLRDGLTRAGVTLREGRDTVAWEPMENFDVGRLPEPPL